jgi:hypothetical protein
MAIVPNKDGQGIIAKNFVGIVDVSYCVPTTFAAGVPATAGFVGEIRINSTTGEAYRFLGPAATNWAEASVG